MHSIQKLLEFETLPQENDEAKQTVDENWPNSGLIQFN